MRMVGFDDAAVRRSKAMAETHLASARRAIEAGVQIVHGTDIPPDAPSGGTSLAVRELELLVEAGAPPLTALRSVSLTAARLLGLEGIVGEIREGGAADLIAVPTDPTRSVSALRDMRLVMQAGDVVRFDRHVAMGG
jgi:imidazolonepropionase-like amidohydrolase